MHTQTPTDPTDPDEYVRENKETLVNIIKHSDATFVRSLCIAALVQFGDDPDLSDIRDELDVATESESKE